MFTKPLLVLFDVILEGLDSYLHVSYPTLELRLLLFLLLKFLTKLELFCVELANADLEFDDPAIQTLS